MYIHFSPFKAFTQDEVVIVVSFMVVLAVAVVIVVVVVVVVVVLVIVVEARAHPAVLAPIQVLVVFSSTNNGG